MDISIKDSSQITQKVQSIDQIMQQRIIEVEKKLKNDIEQLRMQAEAHVAEIKNDAAKNKKFEVDQATQVIKQESGNMVQEIQNLAYDN